MKNIKSPQNNNFIEDKRLTDALDVNRIVDAKIIDELEPIIPFKEISIFPEYQIINRLNIFKLNKSGQPHGINNEMR